MNSVYGTNRTARSSGRMASSEYAIVTVGGSSELGQSVRGSYARNIQTLFELGSPGVLWVPGFESGTLSFQRLVGANGFFHGWTGTGNCGELTPVAISTNGGPCLVVGGGGGLRFSDVLVESMDFSMQAGQVQINEGVNLRVGNMSRG